jgi:hypothetical protein
VVSGAAYKVSALPSPVPVPEGFSTNQFMVNIGLALKELLPDKEGANFSIVNFNALPEAYVPPHFSIVRVLIPVVTVIGIGLIVFAVILILNNRADIAALRPKVAAAETSVTQLQRDVAQLGADIASAKGTADVLNNTLVTMERNRATVYLDLKDIIGAAEEKVDLTLTSISHVLTSITVNGMASNVGSMYEYARYLRDDSDREFSGVWVSPVHGDSKSGFSFTFLVRK